VRARRTDQNHSAVLDAIRAMGFHAISLHAHGKGLEDILVAARRERPFGQKFWVTVEVKTATNKSGTLPESKFTPAQRAWYAQTDGWPRLVVTSAQDAVNQLQELTRG
jgi:hypothetical protein